MWSELINMHYTSLSRVRQVRRTFDADTGGSYIIASIEHCSMRTPSNAQFWECVDVLTTQCRRGNAIAGADSTMHRLATCLRSIVSCADDCFGGGMFVLLMDAPILISVCDKFVQPFWQRGTVNT